MSLVFDVMAMLCYSVVILYGVYRYSEGRRSFLSGPVGDVMVDCMEYPSLGFLQKYQPFHKETSGA